MALFIFADGGDPRCCVGRDGRAASARAPALAGGALDDASVDHAALSLVPYPG